MRLVLIRGLPGAGKSTEARRRLNAAPDPARCCWVEADHFFERGGEYCFDPARLPEAHAACQAEGSRSMRAGLETVIVSNTFTQAWEMAPYRALADTYGYAVDVVTLYDGGLTDAALAARCEHNVPVAAIARMRARWEGDV